MRSRLLALVVGVLLVACGGGGGTQAEPEQNSPSPSPSPEDECPAQTTIAMNTRTFDPDCVEVAAGDTLTIENRSSIRHSFTLGKKVDFDVLAGETGEFEVVDLKKKEYRFFCKYHTAMFVEVVVT
jgi:plastocyanin